MSGPPPNPITPKHLSPDVNIKETPSGPRPIQPVGTSTVGFVGTAPSGPVNALSAPLNSFAEYRAIYGASTSALAPDYVSLAAQVFFINGGQKLYISRVSSPNNAALTPDDYIRALALLEPVDEISTVAAPGASIASATGPASVAPIHAALISHIQTSYRLALLDPPPAASIADVKSLRAQLDSSSAALYYPWLNVANPLAPPTRAAAIKAPPSGFIAGIFARSDAQHGVYKAPANLPILGAASLETNLTEADATTLNSAGINTLRIFPNRSLLVWGARTISSDSDFKYVNVRRYFNYLEHSIQQGTQWAVFEPNGEPLWTNIRNTISNFLTNEWRSGALMGTKPDEAWFVKCDRTTMSQNDLDNGRLVVLIGVAPVKPAEFVIIRIGQWTADHKP
jgi:phage tail sheath protein FI